MWLYDPRENHLSEMPPLVAAGIANCTTSVLYKTAKSQRKLRSIQCYVFLDKPSIILRRQLYAEEVFKGEIWRCWKSDIYVSNYGRVKTIIGQKTTFSLPYIRKRLLTVKIKQKEYYVRELVAEMFLKRPLNDMYLIHKNGNYRDCSVWNLKYEERSVVARKTGGLSRSRAVVQINEENEIINAWSSGRKAEIDLFMSRQTISDYCNRRRKSPDIRLMWEEDYEKEYGFEFKSEVI